MMNDMNRGYVPAGQGQLGDFAPAQQDLPYGAPQNGGNSGGGSTGGGGGGGGGGGKAPGSGQKPQYAKRGKITIVACVPCRKRKTKCDGKRPLCSQCTAREGACHYDMTDDQRKLTFLRDNVEKLQGTAASLQQLLSTVQHASEAEAAEIFRRLRQPGVEPEFVAEQIAAGQLLFDVGRRESEQQGESPVTDVMFKARQYDQLMSTLLSSDTNSVHSIIQRIRSGEPAGSLAQQALGLQPAQYNRPQPLLGPTPDASRSLEAAFSRHDQTFGMVKGAEMAHTSLGQGNEFIDEHMNHPWTNVTQDGELINHLLTLYFTWQHCFFQNFPEQLFRDDMEAGRTKFCSSILVNAICAAGCFLSDREIARRQLEDGDTLMDKFYNQAVHELEQVTHQSTLTTTAALYLMSYVEGTRGRLSSLWMFAGRSVLMAVDLELHLRPMKRRKAENHEDELENQKEAEARTHAFWGCFHVDQTTSFTLGRLPLLNINGITCEPPAPPDMDDDAPWHAYELQLPDRPGLRASAFKECAALSKLVNSTLVMFFAPTVSMSGALLLGEYEKYLEWYRNLPSKIASTENAVPHVISLHMYYHTALLLLFRPFLKATIDYSDVVPRDVCRNAANMVSDLWQQHRNIYGLSGIYMFQVHCLLTACTIHILNVPTISATRHLTQAANIMQELISRNEWARSALVILRGLAEKWRLVLPLEVEEALYRDIGGPNQDVVARSGSMLPSPDKVADLAREFPSGPDPLSAQANLVPNIDYRFQQQQQRNFLQTHPQYAQDHLGEGQSIDPSLKRGSQEQGNDSQKRQRLLDPALRDEGLPQSQASQFQGIQIPQPRQAQMVAQQAQDVSNNFSASGVNFGTGFGMGLGAGGYTSRVQQLAQDAKARSASTYIYSPMANQSAPLLVPVSSRDPPDSKPSSESAGPAGNNQQQQGATQQSAKNDAKASTNDKQDNGVTNGGDKVEGLSFLDDWRDPFGLFNDFE